MNAILCENLVKAYQVCGKTNRVLDVNKLEIKEGSFFGILGQNGAGKSTLINIITSLVSPTSGVVKIFGKNIASNVAFAKTSIGTAVQDVKLDPFPLVWEAMEYQAGYYGIPKGKRRTEELLHQLGLYEHRNKKARMLSGGMQRRLIIAKALVHDPKIIILDEPTAGVDIELRTGMWNFVRDLHKQGKTVIMTTHYLEEVQELCEEIAFIKSGKIILQDEKHNILSILDKKSIIIKTSSALNAFECDGVESIAHEGTNLKINFVPSKISAISLLEKLKNNGIDIQDITIKDAHLDEIFSYIINR